MDLLVVVIFISGLADCCAFSEASQQNLQKLFFSFFSDKPSFK
jgi:hypothetical protein